MKIAHNVLFENTIPTPFRDDRTFLHISDLYSTLCNKANELLNRPLTQISISMIGPIYKDPHISICQGSLSSYPITTKAVFSFQCESISYHALVIEGKSKTDEKYVLNSADILRHSRFLSDQEVTYNGKPSSPKLRILSILPRLLFKQNFPERCLPFQGQEPPLPAIKIVSQFDLNQFQLCDYSVRLNYFNSMNILKSTFLLNGNPVGCEYNKYGAQL